MELRTKNGSKQFVFECIFLPVLQRYKVKNEQIYLSLDVQDSSAPRCAGDHHYFAVEPLVYVVFYLGKKFGVITRFVCFVNRDSVKQL